MNWTVIAIAFGSIVCGLGAFAILSEAYRDVRNIAHNISQAKNVPPPTTEVTYFVPIGIEDDGVVVMGYKESVDIRV